MNAKLKETLWWTVVFVGIAITIACGVRIVDWLTEGTTLGIWKVALALIVAAGGGGTAVSALRKINNGGDE